MCWANTRRTAGNGDRRGRASQSRRDQGSFSCNSLRACLRTICWGACGPLAWQDADAGALSPVLRKGLPVCTYAKTPCREVAGEVSMNEIRDSNDAGSVSGCLRFRVHLCRSLVRPEPDKNILRVEAEQIRTPPGS